MRKGNPNSCFSAGPPCRGGGAKFRGLGLGISLRRVHDAALARVRRSPRIARLLLDLEAEGDGSEIWDYTTLLLCRAMRPFLLPGQRVWDLGCGPHAVLARYALRFAPVDVVASDHEPTCVSRARRVVERSRESITVVESDLGARVCGRFDLVLFNAPYLPLAAPDLLPTTRPTRGEEAAVYAMRFGGGAEGMDTIGRFIGQVRGRLADRGRLLLGFNRLYVPAERVAARARDEGLEVLARVTAWWNPSIVLVLGEHP